MKASVSHVFVVTVVVACGIALGAAQAPSKKNDQLQFQLATLNKRIAQDAFDIGNTAGPHIRNCILYHAMMSLSDQAYTATMLISDTADVFEMYSLVSSVSGRRAADNAGAESRCRKVRSSSRQQE